MRAVGSPVGGWAPPACGVGLARDEPHVESWDCPARESNRNRRLPVWVDVTSEDGKPVASFAFASKAVAEQAATDLLNALSVHPHVD